MIGAESSVMEGTKPLLSLLMEAKNLETESARLAAGAAFVKGCVAGGRYEFLITASEDAGLPSEVRQEARSSILQAAFARRKAEGSDGALIDVATRGGLPRPITFHAGMALVEDYMSDFNETGLNSMARDRRYHDGVRNAAGMNLVEFHDLNADNLALMMMLEDRGMAFDARTEAGLRIVRRALKNDDYMLLLKVEDTMLPLKVEAAVEGKADEAARNAIKKAVRPEQLESVAREERLSEEVRAMARTRLMTLSLDGEPAADPTMTGELILRLAMKAGAMNSEPPFSARRSEPPPQPRKSEPPIRGPNKH
jgi:hypothetical protein